MKSKFFVRGSAALLATLTLMSGKLSAMQQAISQPVVMQPVVMQPVMYPAQQLNVKEQIMLQNNAADIQIALQNNNADNVIKIQDSYFKNLENYRNSNPFAKWTLRVLGFNLLAAVADEGAGWYATGDPWWVFDNTEGDKKNINAAKTSGKKMSNKGHIQVYVPKTFEESFDIINVVKDGITVLVNVEVCNPQVSQRIVDVLTGALVALGGQCKKMGEKQYIFSLNAEMTGAMDYVPSSGQGQYQNGYNYPFQNPFNPMQNPFGQNPMYQNDMGQNNQGFNQPQQNNNFNQNPYNNFNNQPNNRPNDRNTFNPNDYYNPPVSQF